MDHRRHARRSRDEWQRHIAEQGRGELSIEAYCEEQQLGVSSFHNWRRRFNGSGLKSNQKGFIELGGKPANKSRIRIETPTGYRIETSTDIDEQILGRLLRSLAAV